MQPKIKIPYCIYVMWNTELNWL